MSHVIEVIVGGIILSIFSGMLGIIIGNKKKITSTEFDSHLKDENPHLSCAIHTYELGSVNRKLDKIESKIDELIERR